MATIDGLTYTEVYAEQKTLLTITANSKKNSQGVFEIDDNNNKLISNIDSGDTPLYRVSKYSGVNSLLLYNLDTKEMQLCKTGELLNINIDFDKGTRYAIGAKCLESTAVDVNARVFSVDIKTDDIVFRVYMDGRELKSYDKVQGGLKIKGSDAQLVDKYSELTVYTIKSTSISGSTEIKIEYFQYPLLFDVVEFFETDYLETIKGIPINNFESMAINQTVQKTTYRNGFNYGNKYKINGVDNSIDLELFNSTSDRDLVQFIGDSEIRLILINKSFGRVVLVNNCYNNNGTSLIYDKSKNTKKIQLDCGNYIDIEVAEPSKYGVDRYGRKLYSGNLYIFNSHNRGENK